MTAATASRNALIHDLAFAQGRAQSRARHPLVRSSLYHIGRYHVYRHRQMSERNKHGHGGRVLVGDLGQYHEEIEVAVFIRIAACARSEEDDLEWVEAFDQAGDDFRREEGRSPIDTGGCDAALASIAGTMIWDTSADPRSSSWRTARPTGRRVVTPSSARWSSAQAAPAGLRPARSAI